MLTSACLNGLKIQPYLLQGSCLLIQGHNTSQSQGFNEYGVNPYGERGGGKTLLATSQHFPLHGQFRVLQRPTN